MTPKQLNGKVLEIMQKNGSFSKLHSRFLSIVSRESQKESIPVLKPYRSFKGDVAHSIAAEIVFQYLFSYKFDSTLECINAEYVSKFPTKITKIISKLKLKNTKRPIIELISLWNQDVNELFYNNRDALAEGVRMRLESISDPSPSSIKPEPVLKIPPKLSNPIIKLNQKPSLPPPIESESTLQHTESDIMETQKNNRSATRKAPKKPNLSSSPDSSISLGDV